MLAPLIRLVTGVQGRWIGVDPVDPDGEPIQRIYYANHASHLDAPVIWAALPTHVRARVRPVAAREYWTADALRRHVSQQWLRAVLVDRVKVPGAPPPITPLAAALADGDSLILFPEGTRNLDPDAGLLAFKSGLFHLGRQFPAVQIVPVYLANLSRILPKGEFTPVPLIARATFGAPIPLQPDDEKDAWLARARAALAALGEER